MTTTTTTKPRGKNYTKKSPEERREEMCQIHQRLDMQVEELRRSDQWLTYLKCASQFHSYSFNNVLMIMMQNPEATRVAGFHTWKNANRHVRKGERGIRILCPGTRKVVETDEQTGEETEKKRTYFFPVSVWDISQVDLNEGADDPLASPTRQLSGDDETGIYEAMAAWLITEGWQVERRDLGNGLLEGYTDPKSRQVVIATGRSAANDAATIIHEAAHIACGHVEVDSNEYRAHRGRMEVEAESVAHVLAAMWGLDTSAYSVGYIAEWAQRATTEVMKGTAAAVLKAAHAIAKSIDAGENDD